MATLSPFSFPLFPFRPPPPPHLHFFPQFRPTLSISCSAKPRRKRMSDAELRKGLFEFVSSFNLPHGHVPSTKDLAHHGRKDLANIVRRRGYKIIKELLSDSKKVTEASNFEDSSVKQQNLVHGLEYYMTGQDKKNKDVSGVGLDSAEGVPSSEDRLQTNSESDFSLDHNKDMPILPLNGSSLQEKVDKFLAYGTLDLDAEEDSINHNFWPSDSQSYGEHSKNSTGSNSSIQDLGNSRRIAIDLNSSLLNGTAVMSKPIANDAAGGNIMRGTDLSHELPSYAGVEQYIDIKDIEMENQAEVEQLKYKLQLKELELLQLRELIEKEEEALSILQSQAEGEILKTEKLISEMDAELIDAEDSLAGLKEVQIQYSGEGQLVEVAGSFNGWQERIRMDLEPSYTGKNPIESRNPRRWSALLWLYPGQYEIKFVLDGEWKIDPQRETTTRTGMQNNILQVGR